MIASHETKKTLTPTRSPETARKTFQPMSTSNAMPNTKRAGNLSDQGGEMKVSKCPSRSVVIPSREKLAKVAQHGLFVDPYRVRYFTKAAKDMLSAP